jgi:hypothetical protein
MRTSPSLLTRDPTASNYGDAFEEHLTDEMAEPVSA